jgi:hypothetical protein
MDGEEGGERRYRDGRGIERVQGGKIGGSEREEILKGKKIGGGKGGGRRGEKAGELVRMAWRRGKRDQGWRRRSNEEGGGM